MLREAPASYPIRFGVFELDARTGELRKHGVRIPLRDQSFRILEMLVDRRGELVTREEIKRSLWPTDTFVEFDHSINAAVTRLRQALGDQAENPRFIETVPGRGYRFMAPLNFTPSAASQLDTARKQSLWRRPAVAATATLFVVSALAVWLWLWRASAVRTSVGTERPRIVVAIFENRTGEPSLDLLGRIAADWISEGLSRIGSVAVTPTATVLELAAAGARTSQDPVRALARATGASLVVSGAYYNRDHSLRIHASITDIASGRLLYAVEPVTGALDRPLEPLEALRRSVVNAVAARYLSQEFDFLSHESKPPSIEAYREFLTALDIFYNDNASAVPYFVRALELDPEFTEPRVWLIGAQSNMGQFAEAAKQLGILEQRRGRLTPINRRRLDFFRANLSGHYEDALIAQRDVVRLAPGSPGERFVQAGWAIDSNHLREAIEALRAPVRWDLMVKPSAPFGSLYFLELTTALHELGEHQQELAETRRGQSVYPNLLNVRDMEVGALIALGELDEMEKVVQQTLAMPASWGQCSPGTVTANAAIELRAHGYREASIAMAGRAVEWFNSRPAGPECSFFFLGVALSYQELWEKAWESFSALSAAHPDNLYYRGALGTLAVHRGDRRTADRIAEDLQRIDRPYLFGEPYFQRARIASLLGDREGAVRLLRRAIAEGFTPDPRGYRFVFRHEQDLEALRGYPPFQELLNPRE